MTISHKLALTLPALFLTTMTWAATTTDTTAGMISTPGSTSTTSTGVNTPVTTTTNPAVTTTKVTTPGLTTTKPGDKTPLDQPNMPDSSLINWATDAAKLAYSYDFKNYTKQVQTNQPNFTPAGWKAFMDALTKSNNLQVVQNRKLVASATTTGPVTIVRKGVRDGVYTWKVQLPMLATYENESRIIKQNLLVNLLIERTNTPVGVGITHFVATVAPTSQLPVTTPATTTSTTSTTTPTTTTTGPMPAPTNTITAPAAPGIPSNTPTTGVDSTTGTTTPGTTSTPGTTGVGPSSVGTTTAPPSGGTTNPMGMPANTSSTTGSGY